SPDVFTGLCVNGGDTIARADRVDHSIDHDRRLLRPVCNVTGLVNPRHFELAEVGFVNLIERAVTPAVAGSVILRSVVGILAPGAGRLALSLPGAQQSRQPQDRGLAHSRP